MVSVGCPRPICLTINGGGALCANLPDKVPMAGIGKPSFSIDGKHLYVPAQDSSSLVVLDRNPDTGVLTFQSCFVMTQIQGSPCLVINQAPMEKAIATAVSADGQNLYVAGHGGNPGVLEFKLDDQGKPQFETCVAMTPTATCTAAPTIAAAVGVAVSPNGKSVYVAGLPNAAAGGDNSAVTTFNRKDDGSLNQDGITTTERCVGPIDNNACATFVALRQPRDVVVTPDNKQVIVTTVSCPGGGPCNVTAFNRNATTGVVGPANASCIGDGFTCSASPVRGEYSQVVVSKNGDRIYAISRGPNAVVTLARNASTGVVTAIGCAAAIVSGSCPTAASALSDPIGLALSPGGDVLYTGSDSGQRIGIFGLDANGVPAPKPSPFGCIAVAAGCGGAFAQGNNVPYVIASPDGRYVYALGASRVFSFAVDHPPTCAGQTLAVPFNTTVAVTLQCTDPDGDPVSGYAVTSQPGRGTAIQQGSSVNYGPLNGSSGADSFTYTAVANGITADPATVTLNVAGPPPGGATPQPSCLDADHDGFCAGQDCNDNRAAIRPGAREVKGNRIDENCDGIAEPFPTLTTGIAANWSARGKQIRILSLLLRNPLPKGFKAQMRCAGQACPFRVKPLKGKVKRGTLNALASLGKHRTFRAGQVLEVRVSAPKFNTKVLRFTLKTGKVPVGAPFCLPPGVTKPRKRC